ncbi:MAG: methionyl-tRNA formyltransferase [Rickettsiales bacterium]|nr:methionyl-tRNA formyltransferase [Rickettsiales bacterium]
MNKLRIVFMGTPEFAVPTLEKILNTEHKIEAVYTRKAKESGRGQKKQNTPIYNLAEKNNLRILTPATFKNGKNLEELKEIQPDLIVVVAYGLILPKELLEIPKYGCINLHPSLLPKYRGCAPMERCLLSNDTETGVCIMKVGEGLDDGDIISTTKIEINKNTDITNLKEELSKIGADMIIKVIEKIANNEKLEYIKQDNNLATFTDKITNEDAKINWLNDSVITIHNKIRALNDSVGVYIYHNSNRIKILKSDYILGEVKKEPKTLLDKFFSIQCKDGILKPLILQKEGKKPLNIKDFINGYRFNIGEKIDE